MEIIKFISAINEIPAKVMFSFEPLHQKVEKYANDPSHPYHDLAKMMFENVQEYPELFSGIEELEELKRYEEPIMMLANQLLPAPLQTNEIKALMFPLQFNVFCPTTRFLNIINNAGGDFEIKVTGLSVLNSYQSVCALIVKAYYKQPFYFSSPLSLEIWDEKTGIMRHYRLMINADFLQFTKTEKAPELTHTDFDEMMLNADNLDLWKKKMPPNSYTCKGFVIMNCYDATTDVTISNIRTLFLSNDDNVFNEFQDNLRILFNIKDLEIGYSVYNTNTQQVLGTFLNKESLFMDQNETVDFRKLFGEGVSSYVLKESQTLAIPDVELYSKKTGHNLLSQKIKAKGIGSMLLAPIILDNGEVQLIELASPRKHELNSLNAVKLEEILPFVKIATQRYLNEWKNFIESTIQENYTSIHPVVKWRFTEAANRFNKQKAAGEEMPVLEEIVFDKIYPLYGQSDIKGSSMARNLAIQADLDLQLLLVINTFKKIMAVRSMPIYKKLIFKVNKYIYDVRGSLKAGDELGILEYLKYEVHPIFNKLKTQGTAFQKPVEEYMAHLDPLLNMVYKERKAYDDSMAILNDQLSSVLDKRQEEAQAMFPHYFQRYNTDGIEYNIYTGNSLVEGGGFDLMYLHNLRLWQLETMWDIEQKAHELEKTMPHLLQVASLILSYSNPLSIKFKMDEKQFDVNGAYNARYEIIKKRIDKSHIKGTNERVTVPGKITIIYSQNSDAQEYLDYIEYLRTEGKFGEVEMLDIEDLQGVSGLKAIRVEVQYQEKKAKKAKTKLNG